MTVIKVPAAEYAPTNRAPLPRPRADAITISSDVVRQRAAIVAALIALDGEGFDAIVSIVNQQARTAGGFADTIGWWALRTATDAYISERDAARKAGTDGNEGSSATST